VKSAKIKQADAAQASMPAVFRFPNLRAVAFPTRVQTYWRVDIHGVFASVSKSLPNVQANRCAWPKLFVFALSTA
jgi:hypothetical protein